ncbi:Uncharacterized phage-associated protein [Alkalibacterium putridalgicola]|uniref:Uncharacterized phage-associated protein n=1 Tax=Alkalibacterium putridalgicola TaxID=426703 RepID=A0A1H7RJT6_9LACT|nr:type II toxin-antitoxin system antitoxin SocA domain-containing protein [Alkalibacterium putridalgicola]GEK88873.1 hypothetical protein APU01nite_09120 [Alkalibacterium putridalgicola]SEL60298.1 Uncharacterized phage-associated protein [Alkalibacterium putridalgicola]
MSSLETCKEAYFNDVDDLVSHLYSAFGELTPLKLQKTLYFLFAIYSGLYTGDEKEGVQEETYSMPKYLFSEDFEAWTYGPVIRNVYVQYKHQGGYEKKEYDFDDSDKVDAEIKKFISDVGQQIIAKSDFSLVDRSHEDKAWKEAIGTEEAIMDKDEIVNEYRRRLKTSKQ